MKTARIGNRYSYEEVELTDLHWDEERQCIVCPVCGCPVEFEEFEIYDHEDGDYFNESQCDTICKYHCTECGKVFYTEDEI